MEGRYLGFEQRQNARSYRFDVVEKGPPARRFIVTANLSPVPRPRRGHAVRSGSLGE
jgi:hypothetical protein